MAHHDEMLIVHSIDSTAYSIIVVPRITAYPIIAVPRIIVFFLQFSRPAEASKSCSRRSSMIPYKNPEFMYIHMYM